MAKSSVASTSTPSDTEPTLASIAKDDASGSLPTLSSMLNNKHKTESQEESAESTREPKSNNSSPLRHQSAADTSIAVTEATDSPNEDDDDLDAMLYTIDESPPWYLGVVLGFQVSSVPLMLSQVFDEVINSFDVFRMIAKKLRNM